jgi:hypothetical protein
MAQDGHSGARADAKRLAEVAASDSEKALTRLETIVEFLTAADTGARVYAADAILDLSVDHPDELRSFAPQFLARLDDVHADVRIRMLLVITNLARWYPQDLAPGTDLMVAALVSQEKSRERFAAAAALSQIAYFRPDLVTPQQRAYDQLREVYDSGALQSEDADGIVDKERVSEALLALEGGDMGGRPLERDLASPTGRGWVSRPARLGCVAFLVPVLLVLSLVFLVVRLSIFAYRYRHTSAGFRIRLLLRRCRHLSFFRNLRRARLYARRSWIATPTRLLPFVPGTTPDQADPTVEAPPYPDGWGEIATLVVQRDDVECRNCGAAGGPRGTAELHVDHQRPRSAGGSDLPDNLRTLCRQCHEARHARKFD